VGAQTLPVAQVKPAEQGKGSHLPVVPQRWSPRHEVAVHAAVQKVFIRLLQQGTPADTDSHTLAAPQSASTEHSWGGLGCMLQGIGLQAGPVDVLSRQSRPLGQSLCFLHSG
jgi:hypothetical protein